MPKAVSVLIAAAWIAVLPLTAGGQQASVPQPVRGGSLAWKAGWTPLAIADGVFYAGTFKRQLETASLLRRLMAEQGLAVETQADGGGEIAGADTSRK